MKKTLIKTKRTIVEEKFEILLEPEIVNIINLRKQKGLNQDEMSKILGISRSAYAFIETGKIDLRLKHLKRICEYFNINPNDILEIKQSVTAAQ